MVSGSCSRRAGPALAFTGLAHKGELRNRLARFWVDLASGFLAFWLGVGMRRRSWTFRSQQRKGVAGWGRCERISQTQGRKRGRLLLERAKEGTKQNIAEYKSPEASHGQLCSFSGCQTHALLQ